MSQKKYPTQWSYGIPRGYISDRKTNYIVGIRDPKLKKTLTYSYPIKNFNSKQECKKFAEKERVRLSHEMKLTRNEIRFIDKNTIEIKLTQNKTFITDAQNLKIVNKYPLQAKKKKEGKIERFYAMAQDKKKVFKFTDLITKYKIVEYINGNTLDLRSENMKEFGMAYVVKNDMDDTKEEDFEDPNTIEDMAKYYSMSINDLPRNKWILGLVPGTVFYRTHEKNKTLTMRIKDDEKIIKSKTFKVSDYETPEIAMLEVKKYMVNVAYALDIIKNKLRIIDNVLEIMVDNVIVKMDLIYLPLFMCRDNSYQPSITLCKTYKTSNNKQYIAVYNKQNGSVATLHQFLMGSPMIDHINGDSLDNQICNLRYTDYKHNASNKLPIGNQICGVKKARKEGDIIYTAHIKGLDDIRYSKDFTVSEYGKKAVKLAIKFRKNILEIKSFADTKELNINRFDRKSISDTIKRTEIYVKDMTNRMILFPNQYLESIEELSDNDRFKMWNHYCVVQSYYLHGLYYTLNKFRDIIDKINKKRKDIVEIIDI